MQDNEIYDISLSLGYKTFRLHFEEYDEPLDIRFNPSDMDFSKRFFEAKKRIDAAMDGMTDFKLDANGMPETDDYIDRVNEINRIIAENIDYAFGNKISDKLFAHCSPLAMPGGQLFVVQFFEAITPIIQKIQGEDRKNAEKHMAKYLNKYKQ